jgi:hypothetical protein
VSSAVEPAVLLIQHRCELPDTTQTGAQGVGVRCGHGASLGLGEW